MKILCGVGAALLVIIIVGCAAPQTQPAAPSRAPSRRGDSRSRSTKALVTPEFRAIGAVMAAARDDGGTVGCRMAEKGITDAWKAEAVTDSNRSDIEVNLGFPVGAGPAYVVEVQHDYGLSSPTIYRWVVIGGGNGGPLTVYPVNGHAIEIQGDSTVKAAFAAHKKAQGQARVTQGLSRKYDVTFTESGHYRTPEISPFENEVFEAVQAEFDANPAPDPDAFPSFDDFERADKAVEAACIAGVARRYGIPSKDAKNIYMKVGLTQ